MALAKAAPMADGTAPTVMYDRTCHVLWRRRGRGSNELAERINREFERRTWTRSRQEMARVAAAPRAQFFVHPLRVLLLL